jgi:hypothetical protein
MGGWMLADGIFVLLKGKYMGPEKPGPWARLFEVFNINVFRLGPVFIAFGTAWLIFVCGVVMKATWVYSFGLTLSILTLWYLPVGTLFSVIVFVLLVIEYKQT